MTRRTFSPPMSMDMVSCIVRACESFCMVISAGWSPRTRCAFLAEASCIATLNSIPGLNPISSRYLERAMNSGENVFQSQHVLIETSQEELSNGARASTQT